MAEGYNYSPAFLIFASIYSVTTTGGFCEGNPKQKSKLLRVFLSIQFAKKYLKWIPNCRLKTESGSFIQTSNNNTDRRTKASRHQCWHLLTVMKLKWRRDERVNHPEAPWGAPRGALQPNTASARWPLWHQVIVEPDWRRSLFKSEGGRGGFKAHTCRDKTGFPLISTTNLPECFQRVMHFCLYYVAVFICLLVCKSRKQKVSTDPHGHKQTSAFSAGYYLN